MKVSYNWLKEFVDLEDVSPGEVAESLTMAGVAVDSLEGLNKGVSGVVVGRITEMMPHPDADRLFVCKADVGHREVSLVTGAINIGVGDTVPVALPGATLPGDWLIRKAEYRGVTSEGMLCSWSEVARGEGPAEGEGVLVLPPSLEPGSDALAALGLDDWVLELDLTPNYAMHCLSVLGVAREAAAVLGRELSLPELDFSAGRGDINDRVSVEVLDAGLCPRYSAMMFEGVEIRPSPFWMQRRLEISGVRPINNMVDVTNYVMLEMGQPLHAFDYAKLAGRQILVRTAKDGERITTLDGVSRALDPSMLLIADAERAVGVAGVMGGLNSEVTPDTDTIVLESAHFNPLSIRRTSRALGLRTEASIRFEKWVDPNGTVDALKRCAHLISRLEAGHALRGTVDVYPRVIERARISFRPRRANRLLGTRIPAAEMESIFSRLGFGVERKSQAGWLVSVPTRRKDVAEEVDLVEEVARLYGYNRISGTMPAGRLTVGRKAPEASLADAARRTLLACGLSEVVSFSFGSPASFDKILLPADSPSRDAYRILNPIREEQSVLRTTLIPNMLDIIAYNASHRIHDVRIFELGPAYIREKQEKWERRWAEELPDERLFCSGAAAGSASKRAWNRPPDEVDFFYIKGIVEVLLAELGVGGAEFRRGRHPSFHPGRCAELVLGGKTMGVLGEIHPEVLERYELSGRVGCFELDFGALAANARQATLYRPLPRFPSVVRDMAMVVPEDLPEAEVSAALRSMGGTLLEEVSLFDVYRGPQVPEGSRSLAYSLKFRAPDRTLREEEVEELCSRIAAGLQREFGARLRT